MLIVLTGERLITISNLGLVSTKKTIVYADCFAGWQTVLDGQISTSYFRHLFKGGQKAS